MLKEGGVTGEERNIRKQIMKGFECQVVIEQDLIFVSCNVTLGKS